MEQGEFQIPNSEIAKEARAKISDRANSISEEYIQNSNSTTRGEAGDNIVMQAVTNMDQLHIIVTEIPALREYLDRGGRVNVTREWIPRRGRPRSRISLTREGLVISRVGKGGNEFPLTGNTIAAEAGHNGAIDALGGLSPKELLERVAYGIDQKTMSK